MWKETFKKFFNQVYPHKNGDQLLDNIYLAFDTDKSGFISFQELLIGLSLASQNDPIKKLSLIFNIYDRDSSGYLEKSELSKFLQYIKNVNLLKSEFDENTWIDSLNNQCLNREEFINMIMSIPNLKRHYLNLINIFG